MINIDNLDDREREIYHSANEWWATRFNGSGAYDKLGPFSSVDDTVKAIFAFFRHEDHTYPPPATVASRPFAIYAASSTHGNAHVIVGAIYRDGKHRPTQREVSLKRQEEKALVKRQSRRRRNVTRPDSV